MIFGTYPDVRGCGSLAPVTRTLYDGITASEVPGDGWGVAGYVDGRWPDFAALESRFPHVQHISITVSAQGTATVLDVEQDDATPAQAPGWAARMRARGIAHPVVYMNSATWQTVKDEFAAQGVAPPLYWVAQYDRVAVVPAGAVAKQHTTTPGYDVSAVADYWPGVDPAPVPTTTPTTPTPEDDVTTYYPIFVLPDATGAPNSCGVCTWGQGSVHVVQIEANPGFWGDTSGQFRLAFAQASGPDVTTTVVTEPTEKTAVQLASVPGLVIANCTGVTITRPDGKRWPWGGGAK